MSLLARRPQQTYTLAPEGLHAAVCVDVVNMGIVESAYGAKHKVRLVWQLEAQDDQGRRYDVARVYTLSLHERAALRRDLESWRKRRFTEAELSNGFDLEKLLGVGAQLQVTHRLADDGATYANVMAVLPPAKGAARTLVALDYVRAQDRPPRNGGAPTAADLDAVPF